MSTTVAEALELAQIKTLSGPALVQLLTDLREEKADIAHQITLVQADNRRIAALMTPNAHHTALGRQLREERNANNAAIDAMVVRQSQIKTLLSAASNEEGSRFERVFMRLVKAALPPEQFAELTVRARETSRREPNS